MVIMVTLNVSAGISGQLLGRITHYKRLPGLGLVVAVITLLVMAWQAKSLTVGMVEVMLALLGIGFGPAAPLAMVSLQNTVAAHHFGVAVGTLGFMRNLCATIMVAVFGAIVLADAGGSPAMLPRDALGGAVIPVEGFSRIFFAAALSMTVSLIALVIMEEKPLRASRTR